MKQTKKTAHKLTVFLCRSIQCIHLAFGAFEIVGNHIECTKKEEGKKNIPKLCEILIPIRLVHSVDQIVLTTNEYLC